MMIETIGVWSHALAATLFSALAIWQARHAITTPQQRWLVAALGCTAVWALAVAVEGPVSTLAMLTESMRNVGWLGFMFVLLQRGGGERVAVAALYGVLILVIVAAMAVDFMAIGLSDSGAFRDAIAFSSLVLRLSVVIGSLVLVHNLYNAAAPDARWGIRLPMVALAVLWTYDLNLYTVAYLAEGWAMELYALRGIMLALLVPLFALGVRRNEKLKMRLSRTVAFQSLSLVAIGLYLVLMVIVTSALEYIGGDYARTAQISFVFGTTVAALVLLPSDSFRAWFRVKVAKHFFQHRYDYRTEWLRFTDTIGRPREGAAPLNQRVIQAVADITESPGGLLLLPNETGALVPDARWNWPDDDAPLPGTGADTALYLESTGRIIELDSIRRHGLSDQDARRIPDWLIEQQAAWAMVPLVHFDRLAGVVVLARPSIARTLDWEDFDLLRVVGRQIASYLSEARGQEALSEAQRFDEFNRRFAFIMHDIKNLVSQLTLVARNAERHADNPDFRADMIATLRDSAGRMNELLARLSQHNKSRHEEPRPINVTALVDRVAASKAALHPVKVDIPADLVALADPARLEQIIGHLVQNAIDASPPNEPVCINMARRGIDVGIEILDRGCGMSSDFVRAQLFKPFASTKSGGFGVGAFEARTLAASMGGRIEVESREGEGSRFTVILPPPAADLSTPTEKAA
jgi:putative PEP-CTERM system histidine kinase